MLSIDIDCIFKMEFSSKDLDKKISHDAKEFTALSWKVIEG